MAKTVTITLPVNVAAQLHSAASNRYRKYKLAAQRSATDSTEAASKGNAVRSDQKRGHAEANAARAAMLDQAMEVLEVALRNARQESE